MHKERVMENLFLNREKKGQENIMKMIKKKKELNEGVRQIEVKNGEEDNKVH